MKESLIHNFWNIATAVVMIFILFIIGRNLLHAYDIKSDISALEYEGEYYREHIESDSTLLEELRYDDNLEKYARENYRMQRKGESVYIIEE